MRAIGRAVRFGLTNHPQRYGVQFDLMTVDSYRLGKRIADRFTTGFHLSWENPSWHE
jgi:hypothetical protein